MSIFDWDYLARGAGLTLLLSLLTTIISVPLAILFGLVRSARSEALGMKILRWLISSYVFIVRGTPLMLQLMFVFFGLPFIGINLSSFASGIVALTVYCTAYLTEVVRTGIESIAKAQWEGAASLGFNYVQTMWLVILPQAIRIMAPPTVSFLIGLIKDSSLCAVVGIVELSRAGRVIVERTHQALLIFSVTALIYFVMCYPLSKFSKYLEKKLSF